MLSVVGAPTLPRHLVEDIRLRTGTMWHEYIGSLLTTAGVPYMAEVSLRPWMPEGWSGTADLLFWNPELEGWYLVDIKTTKGEGMQWIEKDGMKEEHLWQASSYWHGCVRSGLPMIDRFGILYLPMSMVYGESMPNPSIQEGRPIAENVIIPHMEERTAACRAFMESTEADLTPKQWLSIMGHGDATLDEVREAFETAGLAPEQEMVQKLFWGGKDKRNQWDLKLVPHWSAQFCPYPDTLCACNTRKPYKVGHWTVGEKNASGKVIEGAGPETLTYTPRKGFEEIEPDVMPTKAEIKRRLK